MAEARRQGSRLPAAVATLVAAVVALRLSTTRLVADGSVVPLLDPRTTLDTALSGWSTAGSLGHASAESLRQLPFAAVARLAELAGVAPLLVQIGWRVLLVCAAVAGCARVLAAVGRSGWWAWGPALLYGAGPAAAATVAVSAQDAVAVAVLPWVLAPLLAEGGAGRRRRLRRDLGAATRAALPLALVGVASPVWALLVLVVALLVALVGARRRPLRTVSFVPLAAVASSWWLAVLVWRLRWAPPGALGPDLGADDRLGAVLAVPWPVALGVLAVPLSVAVTALALRAPGVRPVLVVTLLLLAVGTAAVLLLGPAWLVDAGLPQRVDGSGADALLAPAAVLALAGAVALPGLLDRFSGTRWSPMVEHPALALRRLAALGVATGVVVGLLAGQVVALQERDDLALDRHLPPLWQGVADWSATAPAGGVLVLPQLQDAADRDLLDRALGPRPWAAPGSPRQGAAATAALDRLATRLADGTGGPDVQRALAATGARYVLLRDDLGPATTQVAPPTLVRWSLLAAGAVVVRSWPAEQGAPDADGDGDDEPLVDLGTRAPAGATLLDLPDPATVVAHDEPPVTAAGGVGAGPALALVGEADGTPVRLVPGDDPPGWVSDDARRQGTDQRVAVRSSGPVVAEDAPATTTTAPGRLPARRRPPGWWVRARSRRPARPPTWAPGRGGSTPRRPLPSTATRSPPGRAPPGAARGSGGGSPSTARSTCRRPSCGSSTRRSSVRGSAASGSRPTG